MRHLAPTGYQLNMPTKNEILAVRALHQRKSRRMEGKFIVEGSKCVAEALNSNWPILGLYATEEASLNPDWNAQKVPSRDMARMSAMTTPPGVLAVVGMPPPEIPTYADAASGKGLGIILDGLSDPGNLGTIIRTAAWFGLEGIWASKGSVDPFNPKVVQSSMGGIFKVGIWEVDLETALPSMLDEGCTILGMDLQGVTLQQVKQEFGGQGVLAVVGSESHGLRPAVRDLCNGFVHIPGQGGAESLNAAMAAGIAMAAWSWS